MKKRNLIKNNTAVAGVIEALLIVALVAIVLSTIQLTYIPKIMEQREADHMDDVTNQFSFLKSIIDLQSITKEDVPITSPVTLGGSAIPYFVTAAAEGYVSIIGEDNTDKTINVDYNAKIFPLTSIIYYGINYYYYDQTYLIEGGNIFLDQHDGDVLKVEASVKVENLSSEINIYYSIPIFVDFPGKNETIPASSNCYIRTNYSERSDTVWTALSDISSINITTDYPGSWHDFFNATLHDSVNYQYGDHYIEALKKDIQINLYYKEVYIYAQLGPGEIRTN